MRARAILFDDGGNVVLFYRHRPGREPYWAAPGGGVEPGETVEAARRRELIEELAVEAELLGVAQR